MFTWKVNFFAELSAFRLYQILKLRQDVFILEQTCLYPDLDNLDQKAIHLSLISEEDDELIAYCRILPAVQAESLTSIGRVLVSEKARKQGIATKLMTKAINFIREEMQEAEIKISAQLHLQVFYQSLGFLANSTPYDEDGIEHIEMLFVEPGIECI